MPHPPSIQQSNNPTIQPSIHPSPTIPIETLEAENEELRRQLEEAQETIAAIRDGAVDAFVVEEAAGNRIYTLEGADRPYRLFVEEMQQGAATLHADGTIAWCNRQLALLLQTPQERLIGAAFDIFVSRDTRAVYENLLRQGQTRSGEGEARLLRADGSAVPGFLTFNALPKDCGSAIGVLITDLTSQHHHEELTAAHTALREREEALVAAQVQLQQYANELEARVAERTADLRATNDQLEAFVYSIAHDLRTPLRTMTGLSELLVDEYAARLDETGKSLLKRVQASSEFMDKLLLDLLAFGRAARAEVQLGPVEVRKAWEIALYQTATQAEQTHARIEATGPWPVVRAHEATLGQCLANLLSNAMKFVAHGVQPHIRFRVEELPGTSTTAPIPPSTTPSSPHPSIHQAMNGDTPPPPASPQWVRLWVEDNGIGIAPAYQERAFRVFERLNGRRYAGTGIGLSIVRKGIERMGGQVGVESAPGQGSRFWIDLPKAG